MILKFLRSQPPLWRIALFFSLAAPLGTLAEAQNPRGCVPRIAVQTKDCRLLKFYKCEQPETPFLSITFDLHGKKGFVLRSQDYQSTYLWQRVSPEKPKTGNVFLLQEDSKKLQSYSAFIASGRLEYDILFKHKHADVYIHAAGVTELTGEQVSIDGYVLEEMKFSTVKTLRGEGRNEALRTSGDGLLLSDFGIGLNAIVSETKQGITKTTDKRPVEFILPQEPAFSSELPLYGCDTPTS